MDNGASDLVKANALTVLMSFSHGSEAFFFFLM